VNNDADENPYTFAVGANYDSPEIMVRALSTSRTEILDGQTAIKTWFNTAFGQVQLNTTKTFSYRIYNIGSQSLVIDSVTGGKQQFAVANIARPKTIAPGDSTDYDVTFTCNALGDITSTVRIYSNDTNEDIFSYKVKATGVSGIAEIEVKGNGLAITDGQTVTSTADNTAFGQVAFGNSVVKNFKIFNTGNDTLFIDSVSTGMVDFTVTGVPSFVLSSDSATFTVTYSPADGGNVIDEVKIVSNDFDEGEFTFNVSATYDAMEIAVIGNARELVAGQTTLSLDDNTDFGRVSSTEGVRSKMFTIVNRGSQDLTINSISSSNGDFVVTKASGTVVTAGGIEHFKITYTSSSDGASEAVITMANDDGNENPFTFKVGATTYTLSGPVTSVRGQMMSFDGVDDYVEVGNVEVGNSVGNFGTGDFSIETWVKTSQIAISNIPLLSKDGTCSCSSSWNVEISTSGHIILEQSDVDGGGTCQDQSQVTSVTAINDGEWHHILLTRESGTVKIYIDGELDISSAQNVANISNTDNLTIGNDACSSSGGKYFQGQLDEVRIWDDARTQTELRANMHLTLE